MSWITLSLSAALIWAVLNIIDKFVLSKWEMNPLLMTAMMGFIGMLAAAGVQLIFGFEVLTYKQLFLALMTGVLYGVVSICYFWALKLEEVSRVIPLMYTTSFFVMVLAAIFLDEKLSPVQYLGIVLITLGAILITKRSGVSIRFSRGFVIAIGGAFLFAINQVITKHLLDTVDFWTVFSFGRIGTFLLMLAFTPTIIRELRRTFVANHGKVLGLLSVSESCNVVAIYCITLAALYGPISLVTGITSVQPFFVLAFTVLLGIKNPALLREAYDKDSALFKLFAITLMFIGVLLVS